MATIWRALLLSAMIGWFTRGKAFCNNYLWSEKWKYFSTTKRPNPLSYSKYNRSVDFRALQGGGKSGFPSWYVCGYIRRKWYRGTWLADGLLNSIFALNSWKWLMTFFFWVSPGFGDSNCPKNYFRTYFDQWEQKHWVLPKRKHVGFSF